MIEPQGLPEKFRLSLGSAIVLKLMKGKMNIAPTTIYLLTFRRDKCDADCRFCPQAKTSVSRKDMLSRVTWPTFPTTQVICRMKSEFEKKRIKRICIQALNYPTVFDDIFSLTKEILTRTGAPISVSCRPLNREQMKRLAEIGVDRISFALDASTKEIYNEVKGFSPQNSDTWEVQRKSLREAVKVFGPSCVFTHLIVGLGETERQITKTIQWCVDAGIQPSLFAFTPIRGTALEKRPQPSITSYRRIQLARYLIAHEKTRYGKMKFSETETILGFGVSKQQLHKIIKNSTVFMTTGCPSCNRPYYNERPGGPIYNYPKQPTSKEIMEIKTQLEQDNWTFSI